jgi:hypothetical protein
MLAEIDAQGDAVDIAKHRFPAVMRRQPVKDASGDYVGVVTPI